MKFSIIVPTLNNLEYLKILISSIKKNSIIEHEVIVHVNENSDNTTDFLEQNKILYTYSKKNIGLCRSVNKAAKQATTNYILYCHDDMYLLPDWDIVLKNEIEKLNSKYFYLSGTMIQKTGADLILDSGDFAFKTQDFKITRVIDGVQVTSVLHSMIPEDPSLQNRRRELLSKIGKVEVNIT